MKKMISCLLLAAMLGGCGVEEGIKRNDDRYLKPGALDLPLTNVYDTYQYKFMDRYRVTHQWPHTAGTCNYRTVDRGSDALGGRVFEGRDIYEEGGKTWQRFERMKPFDFDRYVRHFEVVSSVFDPASLGVGADGRYDPNRKRKIGETVSAYEPQSLCFESWYATSHSLVMRLHKRDQKTWKAQWTQFNPKGKWSEQRVAGNVWAVQEVPELELSPRAPGAAGGWFQSWLLPIGDTGYTIALQLGASQESMQYPEAHARMKAMFRQLIESVRIEPLQP